MHFVILVEDQSGKAMLDILVPKIFGEDTEHTFEIHPYKGIGHIPKGLSPKADPSKRILLDNLPRLLSGFGKTFAGYGENFPASVVVVCDLDDRDLHVFQNELREVLDRLSQRPDTSFCLAIEESEAWLLGDIPAIKRAYPKAKDVILNGYQNDSICGTWELLADAVYAGGFKALTTQGYRVIGAEKSDWAKRIAPHMDIDRNQSPSFQDLVTTLRPAIP